MPTLRDVLAQGDAGVAVELPQTVEEGTGAPWFVHLFVGLGTWIGAGIAAFFLLAADMLDQAPVAFMLGAVLLASAAALPRLLQRTVLATQLVWVLALGGELAVMVAVSHANRGHNDQVLSLTAAVLQLLVIVIVPQRLLRVASTIALVGALTLACRVFELADGVLVLLGLAVAAAVCVLWRYESYFSCTRPWPELWRPLGFGLAFGLPIPLATQFAIDFSRAVAGPPAVAASLGLACLAIWLLMVARGELGRPRLTPLSVSVMVILVGIALLVRGTPGLIAGLVLLILSHLRREPLLQGLGLLYVGGFLCAFYYQLAMPLLAKSLWVTATGVVLLGLAALLRQHLAAQGGERGFTAAERPRGRLLALVAATAVALAIPAMLIWHQEQVLANGRTVLLSLRPRDPRSLMQGDYMALRYALDRQLDLKTIPRQGKLVLNLDEQGVASLAGVWDGSPVAPGQQLLAYRIRPWGENRADLLLGAESYFFEEGTAEQYFSATYGELKVTPAGASVLVGLRGPELQRLGTPD